MHHPCHPRSEHDLLAHLDVHRFEHPVNRAADRGAFQVGRGLGRLRPLPGDASLQRLPLRVEQVHRPLRGVEDSLRADELPPFAVDLLRVGRPAVGDRLDPLELALDDLDLPLLQRLPLGQPLAIRLHLRKLGFEFGECLRRHLGPALQVVLFQFDEHVPGGDEPALVDALGDAGDGPADAGGDVSGDDRGGRAEAFDLPPHRLPHGLDHHDAAGSGPGRLRRRTFGRVWCRNPYIPNATISTSNATVPRTSSISQRRRGGLWGSGIARRDYRRMGWWKRTAPGKPGAIWVYDPRPMPSTSTRPPTRTHACGELRTADAGSSATLAGWVRSYRDHGGVIFIDLRDRTGITQVVFHPEQPEAHQLADTLRHEDVVCVTGQVVKREQGMANPKLPTGEIELQAQTVEVMSKAATPPFTPEEAHKVGEETRLKHRYLDLRRPRMQDILATRHRVTKIVRDYCDEHGFLEIETPFLCRSTPEGARDFLVPSRLQPGEFYALPQSPQLFKQILMVSGCERYLQIVRCFRDEDPRADRQAEFTQIDMEMSFIDQDEVMELTEGMIREVWKKVLGVEVPPIKRMGYAEAVEVYGSDRPDLRFALELVDLTELAGKTEFKVFTGAVEAGGIVKAIRVPGGASMSVARRRTRWRSGPRGSVRVGYRW